MTPIGQLVEARRMALSMSRGALATRLGVSTQTILNIERDEHYNLGTKLLRQLEPILEVEFVVTARSTMTVDNMICMGNDEHILYIRKNYPGCKTPNPQLGKRIWQWLQNQMPPATKVGDERGIPCVWGSSGSFVSDLALPATATQFKFDRKLLPALYAFLDSLGRASTALDEALALFDAPSRRILHEVAAHGPWSRDPRFLEREVAFDTTNPDVRVRFAPYSDGNTGQHLVIETGKDRVEEAVELVRVHLGLDVGKYRQTESINIPTSELKPEHVEKIIAVVVALIGSAK